MTRFICDVLIDANETCHSFIRDLKSAAGDESAQPVASRVSPTEYLQLDTIAKAAYDNGYVQNKNRLDVANEIKHRLLGINITFQDLQMECPNNQEMHTLLNMSIHEGRAVWMQDFDEPALVSMFEVYMANKMFCVVDTDALLQDQSWIDYFQNFNQTTSDNNFR